MKRRRLTIQRALLAKLLLVSVVPIVVLGLVARLYLVDVTTAQIEAANLAVARSIAGEAEAILREPKTALTLLADYIRANPELAAPDIEALLEATVHSSGLFEHVYLLGADGRVEVVGLSQALDARRSDFVGLDLSRQPAFLGPRARKRAHWSETFVSVVTGELSLTLSIPVGERVIVGNLSLDRLGHIQAHVPNAGGTTTALVDGVGTLFYHPDAELARQRLNLRNMPPIERGLAGEEGAYHYSQDDVDYLGSVARVPETGWLVLVAQTEAEAFASIDRMDRLFLIAIVLAAGLALLVSFAVASRLSRPLASLASAATAIAGGDYERPVPFQPHRETDDLASAFRSMSRAIQAREEQLVESERRYRSIFETAAPLIVSVDADGVVVDCNGRVDSVVGCPRDELVGRRIATFLVMGDDAPDLWSWLAEDAPADRRLRRADGTVALVSVSASLRFDAAGGRTGATILVDDVTERRALEDQLRQAQKMESIGRLAGGVAHDFNNQLTVIEGYCELLRFELPESSPLRESVEEIERAALRSADLTRQLLTFSRKQVLRPETVDVNELISGMAKMLRRVIGEDVRLDLQLAPGLARTRLDRSLFEQALLNLAINARDAMPDGGRLTIVSRAADPIATRCGEGETPCVELAVTDTGVGMDEATRDSVFEPFFTTKPEGQGTGLGLAMVYGFVAQSGGEIAVESEPGEGTTFRVRLPAAEAQPGADAVRREAAVPVADGERIVVVEDDDVVRRLVIRILERGGYEVVATGRPEEALDLCLDNGRATDLLVTDVVMPGMAGPDLVRQLRMRDASMPVLFMTGYSEHAELREGALQPRERLIRKPFTPASLLLAVREALAQGGIAR